MSGTYVGAAVRRREDPGLLRGHGRYVDDVPVDRCLHAAIARSTRAHARLAAVPLDRAHPSVVARFAAGDLSDALRPLPAAPARSGPPVMQGVRSRLACQLGRTRASGQAQACPRTGAR
jgi:carbon-monoxide dehydrogenase large subunit